MDCGWRRLCNSVFAPTYFDCRVSQAGMLRCSFPVLKPKAARLCLGRFQQEKKKKFFQRNKSPVMASRGQVRDPSRPSTLSAPPFTSAPFSGAKVHRSFLQTEPRGGLTSFNKRFTFFPKPNHMSPAPKQDQSDRHLVCHRQTLCSQTFESHPEMLKRETLLCVCHR